MHTFIRLFPTRTVPSMALVFGLLLSLALISGPALAQDDPAEEMPVHPVNINTADADTLALALDGVGSTRAEAIVEYREEHGEFMRVEDLQEVSGIGPATLERNLDRLQVDGAGE
ncbi:MAG: ComEA family DNA-binding protein [Pseudohongiellaceae bacterium]